MIEIDRTTVLSFITLVVTSGGSWLLIRAQRRKIYSEATRTAAETDQIQDARIRSAHEDARDAEERAHKWYRAFYRAIDWIRDHMTIHHGGENIPPTSDFTEETDPDG